PAAPAAEAVAAQRSPVPSPTPPSFDGTSDVTHGDLGEVPDVDHVRGGDGPDLTTLDHHPVDAGAVGRSEVANSPSRSHPDDLRVAPRHVGVAVNGNVEAGPVTADDDRAPVDHEHALGEVGRARRRVRLL